MADDYKLYQQWGVDVRFGAAWSVRLGGVVALFWNPVSVIWIRRIVSNTVLALLTRLRNAGA